MAEQRDAVDRIVREWTEIGTAVDVTPIEIIGRISRLSRIIDRRLADNFAEHDIESWMFDVMATLRRVGSPHELSAGELVKRTMVTTGAMTNRIDRLEKRGFVTRVPSTTDRRSVMVQLTATGIAKVDDVSGSHYELERHLLEALPRNSHADLQDSLRTLLISLGDVDLGDPPT